MRPTKGTTQGSSMKGGSMIDVLAPFLLWGIFLGIIVYVLIALGNAAETGGTDREIFRGKQR